MVKEWKYLTNVDTYNKGANPEGFMQKKKQ